MHLGNGAITPECAAVAFTVAGGGLSLAARSLRRTEIDRDRLLTAGALTGAIFAAQMVNISVLPFSSAHLAGGALAAWVLGPALGAFAMAVVLTSQALLLGDGGLMTLGANIINMALLPSATVALIRGRPTRAVAGAAAATAVAGGARHDLDRPDPFGARCRGKSGGDLAVDPFFWGAKDGTVRKFEKGRAEAGHS